MTRPDDIQSVADHVYQVASSSSYGTFYTVVTIPGQPRTCTCTGYATKRNKNKKASGYVKGTKLYGNIEGSCQHLTAVVALERARQSKKDLEALRRETFRDQHAKTRSAIARDLKDLEV